MLKVLGVNEVTEATHRTKGGFHVSPGESDGLVMGHGAPQAKGVANHEVAMARGVHGGFGQLLGVTHCKSEVGVSNGDGETNSVN